MDDDRAAAVAAHRRRVYRYLLSMTRDPYAADDLTQETMVRALRHVATLRDAAALPSWLYRLATNAFLDRVRADRRSANGAPIGSDFAPSIAGVPDTGPTTDRIVEMGEMSACIRDYINGLAPTYRAAILLHDAYGLTDQEVADALGLTLSTAKMRIHRARGKLRSALSSGCRFDMDDRGVLVCESVPGRAECGADCDCHTRPWAMTPTG